MDDCVLLDHATDEHRAVVTDNIPDFVRCHRRRVDRDEPHFGLLLFTNDTFPPHRHDAFVGQLLAALEDHLLIYADDNDSTWIRWFPQKG